jgi:hypothetical protein
MPNQLRAIIHRDLDAFYAAVEVLETPDLPAPVVRHRYRQAAAAGPGPEMNVRRDP